jgi:hypothetical protein
VGRRGVSLGFLVGVLAVVLAGCGGTRTVTQTVARTVTVDPTAKTGAGPPGEQVEFGYIKSLQRKGNRFVMRFDPAWLLSGVAANTAAAEDGAVSPGEPVPNDNYVVDEGHRLLTYYVSPSARVTAITKGVAGSPITVAQLAQLVAGKNPFPKPLFEPVTTGFWIRIAIDTVRSLDQQYHP